ncbi:MAG: response regulator transcription factor [Treponema sp.]|jgi:two-component system response regulator VanR|nr:response regulator transcription factor [Treponema sp.]
MDITILVVEDDEHIGKAVKAFLQDAGYQTELYADGNTALQRAFEQIYQLVILDIMLPGKNGIELLKDIRKQSDVPVLMMTALCEDSDQITAFNNLADDYMIKPFSMQILLKRVEALLRRSGALQNEIRCGGLTLYSESYKAFWEGQELALTVREFDILKLLAMNGNRVITHESLLNKIWGFDYYGCEGTVHTHIKNLRAKLPVNIIKTIRGVGYTIDEEIARRQPS